MWWDDWESGCVIECIREDRVGLLIASIWKGLHWQMLYRLAIRTVRGQDLRAIWCYQFHYVGVKCLVILIVEEKGRQTKS